MAMHVSTGLRNYRLDTGSLKAALAGGFIHVYNSTIADIPDSADAAIDPAKHTKLLTVYGDGIADGLNLGAANAGAIGKDPGESWAGTVLATGNAVFFRFVVPGDTGAASTTERRLQGRVGVSGAELNISSLALTAGNTQAINYIAISEPG